MSRADEFLTFQGFLHALMLLGDGRGAGFSARQGGAFQVSGDEVLAASQIVHVRASDAERAARLARRGEPPKSSVAGQLITLEVSEGKAHIDEQVAAFVKAVVRPYRGLAT
ncbi:hypothetical protein [Amycolatopsis regifaucium]|uniref:Uncharacterized protein n=1 Tax=Amycolatopsis regifaucium TaxID=546365 RepID=A0A154MA65_9PSEU|nr:hypothetical protein [Amycolatopsis regifaucium]KZB81501.1 hypothetical protein AVL48_05690 [Amycolatopsis regifaucium]OKA06929.1 hypothetical protein ATP06_0220610 [Amycolatopsis regifaucium]SFH29857.1 hypothetical protein SAMN04489731_103409 [Amycolatopsis regifaucium]